MKPRRNSSKIRSPQALARALGKASRFHPGLVFTNGCFDLLHLGHVRYLERARALGKKLVVALNTDASVKRLKGPKRPLNPLADRLEVIAALECVDYVTWFGRPTPLELIRLLKPQTLVKGGDWRVEQIVGSADVLGWGGRVKSLPYIEGRSTTRLIQKSRR